MTDAVKPDWYVVQTHPNAESKAVSHLERQGFETYLPSYMKTARHARRVNIVRAPFFPRYLFVHLDIAQQRWRMINSTIGVTALVGQGGNPLPVQQQVIEHLKGREDADGLLRIDPPALHFKRGDAIRVQQGVFDDCEGIFEARTASERVAVLLDLLGQKVRVIVSAGAVVAN